MNFENMESLLEIKDELEYIMPKDQTPEMLLEVILKYVIDNKYDFTDFYKDIKGI